ncbi:MAG: DNA polymerase/3'-5' exonuclease PolX [Acidimicrobiia bacterium]|nr:DNA polymerase/3'-5' exonuclease PolX [Acidimicrobiia bacterium]
MKPSNEAIVAALRQLVAYTKLEDGQSQSFRTRAYDKAIDAINAAPNDVADMSLSELKAIEGVGDSTARKIIEFVERGSISKIDRLKQRFPPTMLELMKIPGLGPKTVVALQDHLGVVDLAGLRRAIANEQLRTLPGLGKKSEEKIAHSIELLGIHSDETRTPIFDAMRIATRVVNDLSRCDAVSQIAYAGSLRRLSETIGDIDILTTTDDPETVLETFTSLAGVTTIMGSGDTKASIVIDDAIQVDLRVVSDAEFGAALLYFTGSKGHNIELRQRALGRGLTLNEYSLSQIDDGAVVAAATEESIYEALGLPWITPELREGIGELTIAEAGLLPKPVVPKMLRGDLHVHTDWSGDGRSTLDEMLQAVTDRGLEYVAITDHGEDLAMNGLSRERVREQQAAIDAARKRYPLLTVFHGAELNIGPDGTVDYDPEFLEVFEFTVASIHSHFDLDPDAQTARLIAAVENPAVNVIGHPSGRKIGARPAIRFDVEAVAEAAADAGTALEINSHLQRLDLSATNLRTVLGIEGLMFAISTDAHHTSELDNITWGTAQARKGGVPIERVVNSLPIREYMAWMAQKRGRSEG